MGIRHGEGAASDRSPEDGPLEVDHGRTDRTLGLEKVQVVGRREGH